MLLALRGSRHIRRGKPAGGGGALHQLRKFGVGDVAERFVEDLGCCCQKPMVTVVVQMGHPKWNVPGHRLCIRRGGQLQVVVTHRCNADVPWQPSQGMPVMQFLPSAGRIKQAMRLSGQYLSLSLAQRNGGWRPGGEEKTGGNGDEQTSRPDANPADDWKPGEPLVACR